MANKPAVAIVGCGYIGSKRAAVAAAHPSSRVEVVVDIERDKARSLSDSIGCDHADAWEQVVSSPEIDIVVVATTNNYLAPIGLAALKERKHVLCEKPMARNINEARPLVEAAEKNDIILKAGLSLRHHPAISRAHEIFRTEKIGEPLWLRCRYGHGGRPGYHTEWRAKKDISGGGELLDQGIHVADLFNWFLGDFRSAVGFNINGFWQADGVEDNSFALFRTGDDKVASLHVSSTQWKNLFSFEVFGNKGHLRVEGLGGSYGPERLIVSRGAGEGRRPEETEVVFENSDTCWAKEWDEFLLAIKEKRQPVGSGLDAYKALEMVSAVYRSNAEREVVVIRDTGYRIQDKICHSGGSRKDRGWNCRETYRFLPAETHHY